jgi:hypothetical protein
MNALGARPRARIEGADVLKIREGVARLLSQLHLGNLLGSSTHFYRSSYYLQQSPIATLAQVRRQAKLLHQDHGISRAVVQQYCYRITPLKDQTPYRLAQLAIKALVSQLVVV